MVAASVDEDAARLWRRSLDCRKASRGMVVGTIVQFRLRVVCCFNGQLLPAMRSPARKLRGRADELSGVNGLSRIRGAAMVTAFEAETNMIIHAFQSWGTLYATMDPLRLLSRSTKTSRAKQSNKATTTPSNGQGSKSQLFLPRTNESISNGLASKKRKRGDDTEQLWEDTHPTLNFFSSVENSDVVAKKNSHRASQAQIDSSNVAGTQNTALIAEYAMPVEDRKRIMKEHKLRATRLDAGISKERDRRKKKATDKLRVKRMSLFPSPLLSFNNLATRFNISPRLATNISSQGLQVPTEVQLGAIPLLLDDPAEYLASGDGTLPSRTRGSSQGVDLLTVAPTGSGKTLAFLVPLLHQLQMARRGNAASQRHTASIILAPTKELAGQIVNEGRKLAQNIGIKITQMRKGMRFGRSVAGDGSPEDDEETKAVSTVKADVVVATPGVLHTALSDGSDSLASLTVRYFILDEADVLLDPLFREQTLTIWNKLSNPVLRVSLWSATMGSNIEELVQSTLSARYKSLSRETGHVVEQAPLIRLVVGLKDSAVPNVEHKLTYAASEQGKLMGLRQLLRPGTSSTEAGPVLRPPFLVFTQTIERAVALHGELLYDIPAEAGGISRIAVLHSDLSDTARDDVMTRFRRGEIWVLITTDLLSRGVDFLGVNGVVNYDIPTSSAAYVHRIGRTGRAGRTGGVAVTLYSKEDIPYLKHIANIVTVARKQKGDQAPTDQWLLDALPTLSKNEKKDLRRRGIESRVTKGNQKDPKAARKAQISSKSGYDRRLENRRKGAAVGSRRALQEHVEYDLDSDDEFGGFD